jgi:hypothetical protein
MRRSTGLLKQKSHELLLLLLAKLLTALCFYLFIQGDEQAS